MSLNKVLTIVNVYISNIKEHKIYISNIDISEDQINSNTVIEGDFSIPFSIMNIKSRQKINKKQLIEQHYRKNWA